MTLDLAYRHASGVEAQNLVVETVEPGLPLGDQMRLEATGAIAGDRNLDLTILGQDRLRARAVAAVAGTATGGITLLVTQVLGQLATKRPLN